MRSKLGVSPEQMVSAVGVTVPPTGNGITAICTTFEYSSQTAPLKVLIAFRRQKVVVTKAVGVYVALVADKIGVQVATAVAASHWQVIAPAPVAETALVNALGVPPVQMVGVAVAIVPAVTVF